MRKQIAIGILLLIGLLSLVGSTSTAATPALAQEPQLERTKPEYRYIIQPNDVLEIYVWKQTEMSKEVTVLPDGRISIPTVQDMKAAGLTADQLAKNIEEALKKGEILEVPNVTVTVKGIRSYTVYVGGRVGKQGGIMMEKPINLATAIILAGGFTDYAKRNEIVIMRGNGEDSSITRVDWNEVISGRNPYANELLKNGDIVYVP